MRKFHLEFGSRYESYEFGYSTYAALEENDILSEVYQAGFLPHSADATVKDTFYMARSVRVPLLSWKATSENRRVQKKFEGFTTTLLTQEELGRDPQFLPCFLQYFRDHHGERVMSEERATGILESPLPLRGIRYEKNGEIAGYVLEVASEGFSHYWFSCYASTYAGSSFGMWLMLDAVARAKDEGRDAIYLGTAYGSKGRYKTNFEPLEYWNGSVWSADLKSLKLLIGNGT